MDCGKNWLFHFSAANTKLVSFDRSFNSDVVNVKMDQYFPDRKSSSKMLRLFFSSKLDWGSYIGSVGKSTSKKVRVLVRLEKFLLRFYYYL